jgi:hypothetical protein
MFHLRSNVDGQLAWWLPVCSDDVCQFTDEFTLAYPICRILLSMFLF